MVEYANANQGIMPKSHNIWVQYMHYEEHDLDNTFQGRVSAFPIVYFCQTRPDLILQFLGSLPAAISIFMFSLRCKNIQPWLLCASAQNYWLMILTKNQDPQYWADFFYNFRYVATKDYQDVSYTS